MNIKEMAAQAAHPYQAPIAGTWQEKWLERYTEIVRAEALEEAAELGDSMDPLQDGAIAAAIRGLK